MGLRLLFADVRAPVTVAVWPGAATGSAGRSVPAHDQLWDAAGCFDCV